MKVLVAVALAAFLVAFAPGLARSDSTPVGPLPAGPVSTTSTARGQLVAIALPRATAKSGLVWRVARPYDARVVRQVGEADVGSNVVVVFKAIGRGKTSIVFALTRGDTSSKAVKASTHRIRSA